MICQNPECTNEFEPRDYANRYCCTACRHRANDLKQRKRREDFKNANNKPSSLGAIALAAQKAGMTYGKFVSMGGTANGLPPKPSPPRKPVQRNPAQYEGRRKRVKRTDADGNRVVFQSVTDAANYDNVAVITISQRARKGTIVGGVQWEYVEDKANEAT